MFRLRHSLFIVILSAVVLVGEGQLIPDSPCPGVFNYDRRPNGDVYGIITIPYDGSSSLILGVNTSMKGYYNDNRVSMQIKMDTPSRDLIHQRVNRLHYSVFFPFQHSIPRITHIRLNGRGHCDGPPEEIIPGEPGVTSMWSEHKFYFQTPNGPTDYRPINKPPPPPPFPDYQPPGFPVFPPDEKYEPPPSIPFQVVNIRPTTTTTTTTTERYLEIPFSPPSRPSQPVDNSIEQPTNSRNQFSECGVSKNVFVPLILGGTEVSDGEYPWLTAMFVSTGSGYEYKCTGSLVSEKHVVTAARCVSFYKVQVVQTEQVLFVFGKMNLHNWGASGAVVRGASKIETNPEFNQVSGHGDISIITLNRSLKFSNTISPICLWSGNSDIRDVVGKKGFVAGWGKDEGSQGSGHFTVSVAKSLELPVVSNDDCLNSNLTFYSLTSDMTFCAGRRDGTGTCVGDNGAAFMMVKGGKFYLRGLASIILTDSKGNCELSYYMIFSDVAKYANWIRDAMNE